MTSSFLWEAISAMRDSMEPTGISGAPRLAIWYSWGSRTSRTKMFSLASSFFLSCSTVICGMPSTMGASATALSRATSSGPTEVGFSMPQNWS